MDISNKIVHAGGMIDRSDKSLINRIEKFKVYVDELGKVLFEYEDIIESYNVILQFANNVFKMESKK